MFVLYSAVYFFFYFFFFQFSFYVVFVYFTSSSRNKNLHLFRLADLFHRAPLFQRKWNDKKKINREKSYCSLTISVFIVFYLSLKFVYLCIWIAFFHFKINKKSIAEKRVNIIVYVYNCLVPSSFFHSSIYLLFICLFFDKILKIRKVSANALTLCLFVESVFSFFLSLCNFLWFTLAHLHFSFPFCIELCTCVLNPNNCKYFIYYIVKVTHVSGVPIC